METVIDSDKNERKHDASAHDERDVQQIQQLDKNEKRATMPKKFDQILSMFPDIDPRYVRDACKAFEEDDYEDEEHYMNEVIAYLLNTGLDHMQLKHHNEQPDDDLNNQFEYLSAIFPDADPSYLQQKINELYSYPEEMDDFIQSKLENHDYPTIEGISQDKTHAKEFKTPPGSYYILKDMFPDIDPNYILEVCNEFKAVNYATEDHRLTELIDHILSTVSAHVHDTTVEEEKYDLDTQYKYLMGMFTNADPDYLYEQAKELYQDPDKLAEFIRSKIEKPDYPTRVDYFKRHAERKKMVEEIEHYTSKFNIRLFLAAFPDPFKHFENKERKCRFERDAFEFLRFYFKKFKVCTLNLVYWRNGYNLSLTADALEKMEPDLEEERFATGIRRSENIPFLQEVAYIIHKADIKGYFTEREEEAAYVEMLKERNELLECQCCYNDKCLPSQLSYCDEGHVFCFECIQRGVDTAFSDGQTRFACFAKCNGEFPLSVLENILPANKLNILLQKRQEAEVMAAQLDGLVSCPFCYFASIPPPEDKVFKCLNPVCLKESCRICKKPNHIPLKCDEVDADKMQHYLEEKMTAALIRKCYICKRPFYKDEGCNFMQCACGAKMCYICDQMINGYEHFRGQGSTDMNLCPLWSDNNRMNAQTVVFVASEVQKEIEKKNPFVKVNVEGLLPDVPESSRGAHETVLNATVLPARAYKLATENDP